jgi:hypothetical protein
MPEKHLLPGKGFNMPLPLGHTAIGLATYQTAGRVGQQPTRWKLLVWIMLLANLPDCDMLPGLLVEDNGNLFHRGPTHSLLFAVVAGYLAEQGGKLSRHIPRLGFMTSFLLIFSHVVADMIFTSPPVSLFWPFEIHWSGGRSGWGQVAYAVIFDSVRDFGIILGAIAYILLLRRVRRWLPDLQAPVLVRRRIR